MQWPGSRSGCSWDFLQTCHLPPFLLLCSHFLPSREISGRGSGNICNSPTRLAIIPRVWWNIDCGSEPSLGVVVYNPSDSSFKLGVWMLEVLFQDPVSLVFSQLLPEIYVQCRNICSRTGVFYHSKVSWCLDNTKLCSATPDKSWAFAHKQFSPFPLPCV